MKIAIIISSFFLLLSGSLFSQIEKFQLEVDPDLSYRLTSMLQLQDSSYVAIALTKEDNHLIVFSIDKNKSSIHSKIDSSRTNSLHNPPVFITELDDGEILFYYNSGLYTMTNESDLSYELKMNLGFELKSFKLKNQQLYLHSKDGKLVKTNTELDSVEEIYQGIARQFDVTSTNDIILYEFYNPPRFRKITSEGTELWVKEKSEIIRIDDFLIDEDDRVVAVGYLNKELADSYSAKFGLIVRYDENLNWLDQESYIRNFYDLDNPKYDIGFLSLTLSNDGQYLVYGQDRTAASSYAYRHFVSQWDNDLELSFFKEFSSSFKCADWNLFANKDNKIVTYGFGYTVIVHESILVSFANEISEETVRVSEEIPNGIKLYPNPTSSLILVDLDDQSDFQILTAEAYQVISGKLDKGVNRISLGHLLPGVYFLRTKNHKGIEFTQKFLKSN